MAYITLFFFAYNMILGYVVTGFTAAAGKLPMLALVIVDYLLIYYFVSRSLSIFSKEAKPVTRGDLVDICKLIDRKSELLLLWLVVYNIILGIFVIALTTNPIVVLLFLSVNFFFVFYYVFEVFLEEMKLQKFKKSNRNIIKKANAELARRKKLQK